MSIVKWETIFKREKKNMAVKIYKQNTQHKILIILFTQNEIGAKINRETIYLIL